MLQIFPNWFLKTNYYIHNCVFLQKEQKKAFLLESAAASLYCSSLFTRGQCSSVNAPSSKLGFNPSCEQIDLISAGKPDKFRFLLFRPGMHVSEIYKYKQQR